MGPRFRKTTLRLVVVALCLIVQGALAEVPVRIGVLAWQGMEEAQVHWASLARQLGDKLPNRHIVLAHYDLAGMAAALDAGQLDFVVTNPGHYVTLEAQSGITRIATQVGETLTDPGQVVGSTVVVLDRRHELQTLDDLRGKTLAAVSPDAFGGYQLIWAELRGLGIDPERGETTPLFTDFPMARVIDAVRSGQADAGVLRACLLEHLEQDGSLSPGELRVLSPRSTRSPCRLSSPLYPGWAFAAAGGTLPALSREVLLALLSLPPDSGGQAWSVPADYYPVHELLRGLQIGPYAFLRETGRDALLHRYWPWLAGVVVLLLIGGAYTLHVEYRVRRRTRELTEALDARHRLEATVQAGQQQMEHLSRLSILGELSGTLAHELNQPLAAIGNYARSLLRRQDSGNLSADALHQAAQEIASESERAAAILAGIRAFARKRNRVREVCDMAALVRESAALMRGMVTNVPEVALREPTGDARGRRVEVDPLQIQQVLLNLFKNAWDAQPADGAGPPLEVSIAPGDGRCVVTVRDHGAGLPPEVRGHLFEAFFTTKPEGLGLGLSICKTIIEAHGGELSADAANPGPGMVFSFSLPLAPEMLPLSGQKT